MKVACIVLVATVAAAQQFGVNSPNYNYNYDNDFNNRYQGNFQQPQSQFTSSFQQPQSQFTSSFQQPQSQFTSSFQQPQSQFTTQNQYQNDYNSQVDYRNQQEQAFQAENSQQYDNEFGGEFEPLNLPSGARFMLGDISSSFSCADRPYGYYADVDNFCRVFHICNPTLFSDGVVQTYQYSMMCGENTMFDQRTMTCVEQTAASPCQDAPNFYWLNERFGLPYEKQ